MREWKVLGEPGMHFREIGSIHICIARSRAKAARKNGSIEKGGTIVAEAGMIAQDTWGSAYNNSNSTCRSTKEEPALKVSKWLVELD